MRSERALCERITFDLLFRWFLEMTPDEPCFDHSVFSINRQRLQRLRVTKKFSDRIVLLAEEAGLRSRQANQQRQASIEYQVSQRKQKLHEEIFGGLKQYGRLRRAKACERWKIQQVADIALSSLNLIRITRLLKT